MVDPQVRSGKPCVRGTRITIVRQRDVARGVRVVLEEIDVRKALGDD